MKTADIEIAFIYTSPGHNFRGHFGQDAGTNPAVSQDSIECVAGKGIVGDRYFELKDDFKGQITFFDLGVADAMKAELGTEFAPSVVRRNVFLRGMDLNQLIGRRFTIQGIEFEGSEECSPCFWMDGAIAEGAEDFMKGQGGLRARIKSDGTLNRGPCSIEWNEA